MTYMTLSQNNMGKECKDKLSITKIIIGHIILFTSHAELKLCFHGKSVEPAFTFFL